MNKVWINKSWQKKSRAQFVMGQAGQVLTAPCAIGRFGFSARKTEGDGKTPLGRFMAISVFYRQDRVGRPKTRLPVRPIDLTMGWSDDVSDPNYNRLVRLPHRFSHEALMRDDHLYDYVVVLDYNFSVRKRGLGSAIFFHLGYEDLQPTQGCIAVERLVMMRFLEYASRQTQFIMTG